MPPAIELQILRAGDGQYYPKQGETVAVHYTVSLSNGKEVDNTDKGGQPFLFKVTGGEVVKGWDEAVKQLSVGEKASCVFPSSYAYSGKGFPGLIPPRSDLRVTLELVSITKED